MYVYMYVYKYKYKYMCIYMYVYVYACEYYTSESSHFLIHLQVLDWMSLEQLSLLSMVYFPINIWLPWCCDIYPQVILGINKLITDCTKEEFTVNMTKYPMMFLFFGASRDSPYSLTIVWVYNYIYTQYTYNVYIYIFSR